MGWPDWSWPRPLAGEQERHPLAGHPLVGELPVVLVVGAAAGVLVVLVAGAAG